MKKCEWCDMKFDNNEAEERFTDEYSSLSYSNLRKCLCGKCAIEAIDDEAEGIYYETCECCGKEFDLFDETIVFEDNFHWSSGTTLTDYWNIKIMCSDCAISMIERENL